MARACRCSDGGIAFADAGLAGHAVDTGGDDAVGTMGERAHAVIREWLIRGALSPGDKLSLRKVADRLGMSMQPVRQAVARLVSDEALEVAPNRAIRVPLMSASRFRELTAIRLSIEGFAAEVAAGRCTAAQLMQIRRHDRSFRAQCRRASPDAERAVAANRDLHFAVYAAAGLPTLVPIIEGLWLRIGPVLNLDMRWSPERLRMGFAEACHAALVSALEAGSGRQARAALQRDIRTAARVILARGVLPDDASSSAFRTGGHPPAIGERQWTWASRA